MTNSEEVTMEKRAWTARGSVTEADKAVIRGLVEHNSVASRIFITGEVHESVIGQPAAHMLYAINDTQSEPLFIQTRQGTVRMSRFEPNVVWRLFHPDTVMQLVAEESDRLGVDVTLDEEDFYQSLVGTLKQGRPVFPVAKAYESLDTFYQVMYLGCLLLFGKPGYMAVPVSQHFALPETVNFMREASYRELRERETKEYATIQETYRSVQGITNQELNFLVKLYDADAQGVR